MSTATSAAMAGVAASQAAIAAHEAHRAECFNIMSSFDAKTATVETQRAYAGCVYDIHGTGEPLSAADVSAIKVLIVLALIFGFVGARYMYKETDEYMGAAIGFIIGPCVGATALFVVALAIYGVRFLFT